MKETATAISCLLTARERLNSALEQLGRGEARAVVPVRVSAALRALVDSVIAINAAIEDLKT